MQTILLQRLISYVAVKSQSDATQAEVPSKQPQRSISEL